ncbi:RHS repeat-associated core domain-containing protein, partial [Comamonas composti]|uniref:RHS repeat-associated core domain-containing protein n=1 Tax=Comamonas composti TaxID=408558 RepID=UPI00054E8AA7
MTASTEDPKRQAAAQKAAEKEEAVVPLSLITQEDVSAGKKKLDDWLKSISGGVLTLDWLERALNVIPVVSNVMAAGSLIYSILELVQQKTNSALEKVLAWVNIAIDLVGLVPIPGSGPARVSLRGLVRYLKGSLRSAKDQLTNSIITVIENHVSATLAGDLEKFVAEAQPKLNEFLDKGRQLLSDVLGKIIGFLQRAPSGQAIEPVAYQSMEPYEPVKIGRFSLPSWKSVKDAGKVAAQNTGITAINANIAAANKAIELVADTAVGAQAIGSLSASLSDLKNSADSALALQKSTQEFGSIAWLLNTLLQALKGRKKNRSAMVSDKSTAKASSNAQGQHNETQGIQTQGGKDGNCCKQGVAAKTTGSISYATGSETIVHTDFELPGLMPIVWSRTYYSRLGAYDPPQIGGTAAPAYLGARWITPYTTRIDQLADGSLLYHGADGRSHEFPALKAPAGSKPGQSHTNGIENLTLARASQNVLVLGFGQDYAETFELVPEPQADGRSKTLRNPLRHYRLVAQSNALGLRTELQYRHPQGQLSDILSGELHVCTGLDPQGRIQSLWQVEDGKAQRQLAAYEYQEQADGSSDLIAAEDEHQQAWSYTYLTQSGGQQSTSQSTHLLERYSDRTGRSMHLQWVHKDGFETQAPITAQDSHLARAWHERADDGSFEISVIANNNIRMTTVIDALGAETVYYFDAQGYVYRIVHPRVTDAQGLRYTYEEWFYRDANKNITQHVLPSGEQEYFEWDGHSNLLTHTQADGATIHYEYDEQDHLIGIADGEGQHWKRVYTGALLTEETDPLGHTTQYAYNKAGLPTQITDAKGGVKQLAYNSAGQLTAYTDCSGQTSQWQYDALGQLIASQDAAGHSTRYAYDKGQLSQITAPDGSQQQLSYDAEGRLLEHRDALGRSTRYDYTQAGLIAGRTDALGQHIGYQWDKTGRLTALANENAQTHSFAYDPLGKLLKEVHFDGIATHYHYAPESGVLSEVRQGLSSSLLAFDALGRLIERKTGLLQPVQEKDAAGNLYTAQRVEPSSISTDSYAYDGNGQLVQARNQHIQLQWMYDAAGRLSTEHHHYSNEDGNSSTAVWRHEYDELGNRIATTRPDGQHIQWLNYGSGHIHGLLLNGEEQIAYERDALHREVQRHQANQLQHSQQWDALGRLQAQTLSRAQPASGAGASAMPQGNIASLHIQRQYRYDQAGQLTGIADSRRGAIQYKYDPVGRLIEAASQLGQELFAFDPASNILDGNSNSGTSHAASSNAIAAGDGSSRQGHSYNNLSGPRLLNNLLQHYAGTHYRYDERGNLIERIHNGITTSFQWNGANQMVQSRQGEHSTHYRYDPLGRRMAKLRESALNPGHSQRTLYGWDGDQLAWESTENRLTLQAQQQLRNLRAAGRTTELPHHSGTTHYIFEPGSFVPVLQARSSQPMHNSLLQRPKDYTQHYTDAQGQYSIDADPLFNGSFQPGHHGAELHSICHYQCDHLGTPMELTNAQGQLAWSAEYKAWGEAKVQALWAAGRAGASSAQQVRNHLRFQGQYFDEETGLHYNRFRYYDPHCGRFVSRDPIGLAGGINFHRY